MDAACAPARFRQQRTLAERAGSLFLSIHPLISHFHGSSVVLIRGIRADRFADHRLHVRRDHGLSRRQWGVPTTSVLRDIVDQELHCADFAHLRGDDPIGQLPHPGIADVC